MVHGSLIQADPLKVPTQTQKTSALAAMDRLPAGCCRAIRQSATLRLNVRRTMPPRPRSVTILDTRYVDRSVSC
jgi:hypothetical protein